ncbi:MAG: hypothetical protein FWF90_08075 [Promicromonosporaceae bacterium]|nr:hypothetical protein [Promicromonosporaceae bacterium]
MSARTQAPPALAPLPERPRVAEGTELDQGSDGGPSVVRTADGRYVRVAADMLRLLMLLDGTRTVDDLVDALGAGRWDAGTVVRALESLQRAGFLDDGVMRGPARARLFTYVPPLTFQLTVARPERAFEVAQPVTRVLLHRRVVVAALAFAAVGLVVLAVQGGALLDALSRPLPLGALLAVVAASFLTTALHEVGHGAALAYAGGRPSRLGVMLFYLTPAFFCDVTDGWRLRDRRARVRVAIAGIVVQLVAAAAASLAALVVGPERPDWRSALLLFAASTVVTATMNLVPLVKLDGYIALMSHLDVPFLRERAMTDARRAVARALFGGRYASELPDRPWAVPFGLASLLFPAVLVAAALGLWLPLVLGLGVVGAVLMVCLLAAVARFVLTEASRVLAEALAAGASRARCALVSGLVTVAVGAMAFTPVPYTVTGGFVQRDGGTQLVLARSADADALVPGTSVRLERRGIVASRPLATVHVAGAPQPGTAPVVALFPVVDLEGELPVTIVRLTDTRPASATGFAVADAGTRPAWRWLYLNYLAPFWR